MNYRCPTCAYTTSTDIPGAVIDCPHAGTRYAGDGRYKTRMMPAHTTEMGYDRGRSTGDPGTALEAQPGAVAGTFYRKARRRG